MPPTVENEAGPPDGPLERLLRRKRPATRWTRPVRTSLRTLHLIAMAAFFGAVAFGIEGSGFEASLHATVATGLLFSAHEVWIAPIWAVQVRGLATALKTLLLLLALAWPAGRLTLAVLLIVIGSVVSHAPGRIRYWSLVHRRVVESDGSG